MLPGPRVMAAFRALPARERWFVRGRFLTAPLDAIAVRAPRGRIAEMGCGHGALTALLAVDRKDRQVIGVDPDARKIDWARQALGRLPNVELRQGTLEALSPELDGALDAVVVADVLYLLAMHQWIPFLRGCRQLLKPSGVLLLKEVEADRSWKHWKALLQESLMVKGLNRTHSSGGLHLIPRDELRALLGVAGLEVREVVRLGRGYSTPHVLFVGKPSFR